MKSEQNNKNSIKDLEIDLKLLINILWEGKLYIISISIMAFIISVCFAMLSTVTYQSSSLARVNEGSDTGISSALSQYGTIASIAGISLPSALSDQKSDIVMEVLRSREFTKNIILLDDVLPSLMAAKAFDKEKRIIVFDESRYDSNKKIWLDNGQSSIPPSYLDVHKYLHENVLTISENKISGSYVISVEHISPEFAYNFLNLIIDEVNKSLRIKDLTSSKESLKYLEDLLATTNIQDVRISINKLIQNEIETQMLASIQEEYALRKIDPPYLPIKKYKPYRTKIVFLGTIIGAFLSLMFVIIRIFYHDYYKNHEI